MTGSRLYMRQRKHIRATAYCLAGIFLFLLVCLSIHANQISRRAGDTVQNLEQHLRSPSLSGKDKLNVLFELIQLSQQNHVKKAITYCYQAITLAGQLKDTQAKANAHLLLAANLLKTGEKNKAVHALNESLELFERSGDKAGMADAMNRLGMHYVNIDFQNIAQEYLLKALKIRQELGGKEPLYKSNLFLGVFYLSLENCSRAIGYFNTAMKLAHELKDNNKIMICSYYTGVCLLNMDQPKPAMNHLKMTHSLAEQTGNSFYIAASLNWIAKIHGLQEKNDLALKELAEARAIQEQHKFNGKLIYNYNITGDIYNKIKNPSQAAHFFHQTLKLADQLQDKQMKEQVLKKYALMLYKTGDSQQALQYYKKHVETRKLFLDETRMKQISELEQQFDSEKRTKEIELLKRQGKIQQITRNTSLIILGLSVVILFLIFKQYLYLLTFWKAKKFIGHFRIIDKIGSGGMGTVYLTHPVNDKTKRIAVKLLREERMEEDSSKRRFKHEGAIIDKLEHPNIVKIYERGEFEGKLYIAMEYLDGLPLSQKIKQDGPLSISTALPIMKQLAAALAFIHENQVVHRDIKPANIILMPGKRNEYKVKLLDFGVALARSQTRLTESGMLVGTIHYLAPEQISGNLDSFASDVYALGITYFEMIAGTTPFPQHSVTAAIEHILDETPPEPVSLRKDIPGELNRLILHMLDKTPGNRPRAQDVLGILSTFADKDEWLVNRESYPGQGHQSRDS